MKILIAGGRGFLGAALNEHLTRYNHQVFIMTRHAPTSDKQIRWDGKTLGPWVQSFSGMDAVINVTGFGLQHWPWTQRNKQRFIDSRVVPGLVLAEAFEKAARRPGIFVQTSGI